MSLLDVDSKSSVRSLKSGARASSFIGMFRKAWNGKRFLIGDVSELSPVLIGADGRGRDGPRLTPHANSKKVLIK